MLFNSYVFLFAFLPIVFTLYFLFVWLNQRLLAKSWLVLSSLFFYGYWKFSYLPLIIISLIVNYGLSLLMTTKSIYKWRKGVLVIGILFNLGLLGYFKYYDFFIANVNAVIGSDFFILNIALPLAISFFTFQQLAFIVDVYKEDIKRYNPIDYSLFVTFFPQLIAGPIVHHKEVMPQFEDVESKRINIQNISLGLYIFFIGLFKKVVIADQFAKYANAGFGTTNSLTFVEGWITSLSYTIQLYFDFSGYSDMAIGLGLLFNIKLPINFNSPYKSLNITEFWKRWHITLSRFLTRYLYIPLGGNRKGVAITYLNVMIVFLLSGLWHGAGWTFVLWGFLHGFASVVHRWWSTFNISMPKWLAWFITFQFVNFAWVFFRAESWQSAVNVLRGMFGLNGFTLPATLMSIVNRISPDDLWIMTDTFILTGSETAFAIVAGTFVLMITLLRPNSIEMASEFKPSWGKVVFTSIVAAIGILSLTKVSEFLYFNF